MRSNQATRIDIPALIEESRQVYQTEPVQAALMLHRGINAMRGQTDKLTKGQTKSLEMPSYKENVLKAAFWSLDIMAEDAQAGIAPTPSEWDLNISVAESIVRMTEATNDPT